MIVETLVVYSTVAIVSFYLIKYSRRNSYGVWVAAFLFSLVFGIRFGVGVDFFHYSHIYENWEVINGSDYGNRLEYIFRWIVVFLHSLNADTWLLFIILTFLQVLFLYGSLWEERDVLCYVPIILIASGLAVNSFCNIIRQMISFCIFAYAIRFVVNKQVIKYLILFALAYGFHRSSIIPFILGFVFLFKTEYMHNVKAQIVFLVIAVLLGYLNFVGLLSGVIVRLSNLVGYHKLDGVIVIGSGLRLGAIPLMELILQIIIIAYSIKIKEFYNNRPAVNAMYDCFYIGIVLSYLLGGSMLVDRIFVYFNSFSVIIYAYALRYFVAMFNYTKFYRLVASFCVLFFVLSFTALILYSEQHNHQYITCFQEDKKVQKLAQYNHMMMRRQYKSFDFFGD